MSAVSGSLCVGVVLLTRPVRTGCLVVRMWCRVVRLMCGVQMFCLCGHRNYVDMVVDVVLMRSSEVGLGDVSEITGIK